MYVKLKANGTILKYPYYLSDLYSDNPDTSFPDNLLSIDVDLSDWRVYKIMPVARPEYNQNTHVATEATPALVNGVWTQQWAITALDAGVANARIQANVVAAVQARLDTFANTRNYDGILSACTYATSQVPKFAAEGQRAVDLRDSTWNALYTILAEVQAGNRVVLVYTDIESELPVLSWNN